MRQLEILFNLMGSHVIYSIPMSLGGDLYMRVHIPISRFSGRALLGFKPVGDCSKVPTPRSRVESGVTATACNLIQPNSY